MEGVNGIKSLSAETKMERSETRDRKSSLRSSNSRGDGGSKSTLFQELYDY